MDDRKADTGAGAGRLDGRRHADAQQLERIARDLARSTLCSAGASRRPKARTRPTRSRARSAARSMVSRLSCSRLPAGKRAGGNHGSWRRLEGNWSGRRRQAFILAPEEKRAVSIDGCKKFSSHHPKGGSGFSLLLYGRQG
jgi:hypothetical protein